MSYIIYYHYVCSVRDTILLSSFQRFPVDGRKRLEYATCGSVLQKKKNRGKNLPFSTISGYVLKWPQPRLKVRIFGTRKCLIKRVDRLYDYFFSTNEENSKVSFNLRPQRWSHEKGFHYIYHPNTSTQLSPPLLDSLQSAMSWPYQIQNC